MPRDNSFNKLVTLLESVEPLAPEHGADGNMEENHHEGGTYMAVAQVNELLKNAQEVLHMLEELPEDTCLEPWQQSKLTLANDYIEAVKTAMSSPENKEEPMGIEVDEIEVDEDGMPGNPGMQSDGSTEGPEEHTFVAEAVQYLKRKR